MTPLIVVDSSVLIGIIRRERGHEKLAEVVRGGTISAVNYSDVITHMTDLDIDPTDWRAGLESFQMIVAPFDLEQCEAAGILRRETRHIGLSLGDRACLALARTLGTAVLTADRDWAKLDIGIDIRLVR